MIGVKNEEGGVRAAFRGRGAGMVFGWCCTCGGGREIRGPEHGGLAGRYSQSQKVHGEKSGNPVLRGSRREKADWGWRHCSSVSSGVKVPSGLGRNTKCSFR